VPPAAPPAPPAPVHPAGSGSAAAPTQTLPVTEPFEQPLPEDRPEMTEE
jgi:hypothetical protein